MNPKIVFWILLAFSAFSFAQSALAASCVRDGATQYCVSYSSRTVSFGSQSNLPTSYRFSSASNYLNAYALVNGVKRSDWIIAWKSGTNCLMALEKISKQNVGLLCYASHKGKLMDVVEKMGFPTSFQKSAGVRKTFSQLSISGGKSKWDESIEFYQKGAGYAIATVFSNAQKSLEKALNCYRKGSCAS